MCQIDERILTYALVCALCSVKMEKRKTVALLAQLVRRKKECAIQTHLPTYFLT